MMPSANTYQRIGFYLGIVAFISILSLPFELISTQADKVLALAAWMIIWWITEAVAIPITALLPLALFPTLGIMEIKDVAVNYADPIVYLFFGGFILGLALEKVNLHKRIALSILKRTGTQADRIVLGFMLSTALMSMWISNTACTVVMLPIAYSVYQLLMQKGLTDSKQTQNFALTLMLGIAYAASIGGMATLVGTPPNSVMLGILHKSFHLDIGFFDWMKIGVPFSVALLFITYYLMVKVFYPNHLGDLKASGAVIDDELSKLGAMTKQEKMVLTIFACTALAWMFRPQINSLLPSPVLNDTVISMLAAIALFTIPKNLTSNAILDWQDTKTLPWGILVLFGGGLALADGLSDTGISQALVNSIAQHQHWPLWLIALMLITLMLFMTELMSNVALVTILVPLVAALAVGMNMSVIGIVIPVTLASSCAFMLPMGTPPNAIVFASGHIKMHQMVKIGFVLNLLCVALLMGVYLYLIPSLLAI